jgi:4-amino-4-deoxy-L-arabinose transferase-like glycosyltransferase
VKGRRGGWIEAGAVLALFVGLAALRLYALDADPPQDLHYQFFTDEGWWAHNAREQALFGHWLIDEHNLPVYATPLYSLGLRGLYAVFGVGLLQTRLISVLSGLLTCGLVYAFLRRSHGWKAAWLATWLLGTNYFVLSYDRVGFQESFQLLFVTATLLAVVAGMSRTAWATAAGVLFVASGLTKPTALTMAPPIAAFWLWQAGARRREGRPWSASLRGPLAFCAAAAATSAILAVVWVIPHWSGIEASILPGARRASLGNPLAGFGLFGLVRPLGSSTLAPNGFLTQTAGLLVLTLWVLCDRIAAPGVRLDPLRRACWSWLGVGALVLGCSYFQPDRRYLILLPPLAILAGLELADGALAIPGRERLAGRAGRWRRIALALAVGGFAGLCLRHPLANEMQSLWGWSRDKSGFVAWAPVVAAAGALAFVAARWLPARPLRVPALAVVGALAALDLLPFGAYLARPVYSIRDASVMLGRMTDPWKPQDRVFLGEVADTLALDTRLFAFTIRDWPDVQEYLNLDGWQRYRPALVVDEPPRGPGFVRLPDLELWPDRDGTPRVRVPLYVRADLAPRTAHAQPGSGSETTSSP